MRTNKKKLLEHLEKREQMYHAYLRELARSAQKIKNSRSLPNVMQIKTLKANFLKI